MHKDSSKCQRLQSRSRTRKPANSWPNRAPIPALIRQGKNRDSLGFPRRSRWWIVASMAVLFSLSAIIAMSWYDRKLRPLQKYELAGTRLRPVRHSQGWESSSDYQRNWKADRYDIWEQLDSQNGLFNCYRSPPKTWANWTRLLHRNAQSNHILLPGETAAIIHCIRDNRATPRRSSAGWIRVRNRRRRHHL